MILEIIGFIVVGAGAGAVAEDIAADHRRKREKEKDEKIKELNTKLWNAECLRDENRYYKQEYYRVSALVDCSEGLRELNRKLTEENKLYKQSVIKKAETIKELKQEKYKGREFREIFKENDKLRCIAELYVDNLENQIKNCKYGLTVSEGSEYTRLLIELEAFNRLKSHIDRKIPEEYKKEG